MIDEVRKSIYSLFDKKGIAGRHLAAISFAVNINESIIDTNNSQRIFIPDLSAFGLDESDSEQIVIDYVYDTTNVKLSSVNQLMRMRSLNGKPFFFLLNEHDRNDIRYCLASGKVPGSIIFREYDNIESLGNIEEIDGDLGFSESNIKDLGKLKKITGSFWIAQSGKSIYTLLNSLDNLEYVGRDLNIKNSQIMSLGNLKYVGGTLNLRLTQISRLQNLEFIGGNLFLPKKLKGNIDTSKIIIEGKIKYFNDATKTIV